jgi:4-phytase/acid phosphatase
MAIHFARLSDGDLAILKHFSPSADTVFMGIPLTRCIALAACCVRLLAAQHPDTTVLKQVIIFGRHAVRTPNSPNSVLNNFSVLPYPTFPVSGLSVITPNGQTNETLLGAYFRLWLTQEKLLTGDDAADNAFVYLRADGAPLLIDTARAFAAGLLPAAPAQVNSTSSPDPLFHPVDAGVAHLNTNAAVAAVNGRLGGNPQALATAYAAELALLRSALFNYPAGATPAPPTPAGKLDVTAAPFTVSAGSTALPANLGGLMTIDMALDPLLMEYADGLPSSDVAWGGLNAGGISQVFRLYDRTLDLEYRTPYLAGVQSSNLASHINRTLLQAATGNNMSGALGTRSDKVIGLIASNFNIAGLAGLLNLDWLVPGYQADVAAPGGALVFELRQSLATGEFIIRTVYVTQTMDQLRTRAPLTLAAPPAVVPVFVPGCSTHNATFDCPLEHFVKMVDRVVDPESVDLNN